MHRVRVSVRPLIVLMAVIAAAWPAAAGRVRLAWDPVPGAQRYLVSWGSAPNQLNQSRDVGQDSYVEIQGLADCTTWHFVVQASNAAGTGPPSAGIAGLPAPRVTSATPWRAEQGQQVVLDVEGFNFVGGATLDSANPGVRLQGATTLSCNRLQALADVDPAGPGDVPAPIGWTDLTVTNPDGLRAVAASVLDVEVNPGRFDVDRSEPSTDERINGLDLGRLARRWGGCNAARVAACDAADSALYDPDLDFDGNGWIDGADVMFLSMSNWGKCWDAQQRSWSLGPVQHPLHGLVCPGFVARSGG